MNLELKDSIEITDKKIQLINFQSLLRNCLQNITLKQESFISIMASP